MSGGSIISERSKAGSSGRENMAGDLILKKYLTWETIEKMMYD